MNEEVKDFIEENWLYSLGIVVLLLVLFIIIHYVPGHIRSRAEGSFDGETKGIVISVKAIKNLVHSKVGSGIRIRTYEVKFQYKLNEKFFERKDFIQVKMLNDNQLKWLKKLQKEDSITVLYQTSQPDRAIIKIKE